MSKLFLYLSVFTISVVFYIESMLASVADGVTGAEMIASSIAFLCITISALLALWCMRSQIREDRREIARIEKQIARNEAKRRAILREMNALRPEIRQRLPKSRQ